MHEMENMHAIRMNPTWACEVERIPDPSGSGIDTARRSLSEQLPKSRPRGVYITVQHRSAEPWLGYEVLFCDGLRQTDESNR